MSDPYHPLSPDAPPASRNGKRDKAAGAALALLRKRRRRWEAVYGAADDALCPYCRVALITPTDYTLEHMVPQSLGGGRGKNLILVCSRCNTLRGDYMTPALWELRKRGALTPEAIRAALIERPRNWPKQPRPVSPETLDEVRVRVRAGRGDMSDLKRLSEEAVCGRRR